MNALSRLNPFSSSGKGRRERQSGQRTRTSAGGRKSRKAAGQSGVFARGDSVSTVGSESTTDGDHIDVRNVDLRNYDLFCLTKLLSVSTTPVDETSESIKDSADIPTDSDGREHKTSVSSSSSSSSSSKPPGAKKSRSSKSKRPQVTINVVASGGRYGGREFIALSCSNKHLIIRSIGSVGNLSDTNESLPLVRMIPWFDYPVKRITAMDFSPSGSWLLCVTLDAAIYLIPIRSLLKFNPGTATQGVLKPSTETLTSAGGVRAGGGHRRMHSVDLPSLAHRVLSHSPYSGVVEDMFMFGDDESQFHADEAFGPFDDITEIEPRSRTDSAAISHCLWWQTFEGDDYAFVTSLAGTIDFVNLRTHKRTICRLGVTIYKIEMIIQGDQSKTLLIHTLDEGYFLLLLEQKIIPPPPEDSESSSVSDVLIPKSLSQLISAPSKLLGQTTEEAPREPYYQTYPRDGQKNKDDFTQRRINFFPKGCRLSVQHRKSGPVIGVYNPQLHTFALYDVDHLHKPPMFEYKIAPAQVHHFTERFIFSLCIGGRHQKNTISVISNILATAQPGASSPSHESVMQTLMLPPEEKILGIFRVPQARLELGSVNSSESDGSLSSSGFMLWTSRAVYWCHRSRPAASLFFELVQQGRETTDAEHLGKTLSLNLHALYERAGDQAFTNGDHKRAMNMYRLSNAKISKLVKQFLVDNNQTTADEVRDLEAVMGLLKGTLSSGLYNTASSEVITSTAQGGRRRPGIGGLVTARGMVSDLLFMCYLQCFLRSNDGTLSNSSEITQQFKAFVETNIDFEAERAILKLLEIGNISMVLRIAHKRHRMRWCLDLIAEHGAYHLTRLHIDWLLTRGYASLLIGSPATLIADPAGEMPYSGDALDGRDSTAISDPSDSLGTVIFRSLPPIQQLKVIMFEMTELQQLSINTNSGSSHIEQVSPPLSSLQPNRYVILSTIILPGLDIVGLVRFAKFVDTIVDPPAPNKLDGTSPSSRGSGINSPVGSNTSFTSNAASMSSMRRAGAISPNASDGGGIGGLNGDLGRKRRKKERFSSQNLLVLPTALVTVFLQAIIRIRYLWKDPRNRPENDPVPSRPPSPQTTPSQGRSFRRSINDRSKMRRKRVENLSGGPVTIADIQYYATRRLAQSLKVYSGLYPVESIVSNCIDTDDWEAAARIYESEKRWSDAIQCVLKEQYLKLETLRLQNVLRIQGGKKQNSIFHEEKGVSEEALPVLEVVGGAERSMDLPPLEVGDDLSQDSKRPDNSQEDDCMYTILDLISTHIAKIVHEVEQAVHIVMIFNFFEHYQWDTMPLEETIFDCFRDVADCLCVFLFTPDLIQPLTNTAYRVSDGKRIENESVKRESGMEFGNFDMFRMDCRIKFSSKLYLSVTKYKLQQTNPDGDSVSNF